MAAGFLRGLALLLLAGMLVGCTRPAVPTPLITSGDADAAAVAVALQSNGTQHYAWTQCAEERCSLVYQRAHLSKKDPPLIFDAPADESYLDPDIAVTDEGDAFIVWRSHSSGANTYDAYYVVIGPATTSAPARIALHPGAPAGAGSPKIVAGQGSVYAVYLLSSGSNTLEMRYRQLHPIVASGPTYQFDAAQAITLSDPLIDSEDGLHIALRVEWPLDDVPQQNIVYVKGEGLPIGIAGGANLKFSVPALAVANDDSIYGAYWKAGTATDTLHRFHVPKDSTSATLVQVNLDSTKNPWRLRGEVDIEAGDASAIAFSARNQEVGNFEVWLYSETRGRLDQVTSNPGTDDAPRIAKLRATHDGQPVGLGLLVWRTQVVVMAFPLPPRSCYQIVYASLILLAPSSPQPLSAWQGGCENAGQDFTTNGEWAAGIWIDQRSSDQERLVPWTTYNAYFNELPLIMR